MCGIAGIFFADPSRVCEAPLVDRMRDIVSYRGPDDAGTLVDGPVGLGHRRLSIIDLGGGHQPMASACGRLRIIFNGEIYNYREAREWLVGKGHRFQTASDTEVILALYAELGERCVERMNGMFAFAIWDSGQQTLFLARDRMGVKPLYYAVTPDAFVFASEIKSLFASGKVEPRCREEALSEYLVFRQVAGQDTLFRDIKSLPPGCTMTVRGGQHRITRFWSPLPPADRPSLRFEEVVETLGRLLEDSVKLRLVSDVPVGTFCSGGIDSSLVTALASRLKGDGVNTFSIGFDDEDYDESRYARMASERYRTTHHQLNVGNDEFSDLFPRMVWHNDEPLDFANSVHIFALSRLAKQHVTVVLTGEGSDELFSGYPRYRIPGLAHRFRRVPAPLRSLAGLVTRDHRIRKLNRFSAMPADDALLFNSSYVPAEVASHLSPELPALDLTFRRDRLAATTNLGLADSDRLSLLDQECFLVSILHRQDKMSMAAGIESRVPFMDYRLVEFANSVSGQHKIVNGSGKAPVKAVARRHLPTEIVDRRKSGFGVPLASWFRSDSGLGERLTNLPRASAAQVFDPSVLERLIQQHRSGSHDHSELLWTALNVVTWRETFKC